MNPFICNQDQNSNKIIKKIPKGKSITKQQAVKVIKSFMKNFLIHKRWYKNIKPYIQAIVLYGSVAKEMSRPDSDIDFLIFVPLEVEKKYTSGEYFYNYGNFEINIVLRSIERLRSEERRVGKEC